MYDMTLKLFQNSWSLPTPSTPPTPPPQFPRSWAGEQLEKFALKLRSFAYNVRVLANIGRLEVQQWQWWWDRDNVTTC